MSLNLFDKLHNGRVKSRARSISDALKKVNKLIVLPTNESQQHDIQALEWSIVCIIHFGSQVDKLVRTAERFGILITDDKLISILNEANERGFELYTAERAKLSDTNVTTADIDALFKAFCIGGAWDLTTDAPMDTDRGTFEKLNDLADDLEQLGRPRRMLHAMLRPLDDVDMASRGWLIPNTKSMLCREIKKGVDKLYANRDVTSSGLVIEALKVRKLVEELKDLDEIHRVCVVLRNEEIVDQGVDLYSLGLR